MTPGPPLLGAVLALGLPALLAAGLDSCAEAAWWAPLLVSTGLAAAAFFVFGQRRGHPVLGVLGALVGGSIWFVLALLVTFFVWLAALPGGCDATIWSA